MKSLNATSRDEEEPKPHYLTVPIPNEDEKVRKFFVPNGRMGSEQEYRQFLRENEETNRKLMEIAKRRVEAMPSEEIQEIVSRLSS